MMSAALFNGEMHQFLSKQQSHQDSERGEHEEHNEANDGSSKDDETEPLTAQTSFQDIRKLNSNLLQLTAAQQLHLVQQDKLLCLLDALDAALQQGETLLIGHYEQVSSACAERCMNQLTIELCPSRHRNASACVTWYQQLFSASSLPMQCVL